MSLENHCTKYEMRAGTAWVAKQATSSAANYTRERESLQMQNSHTTATNTSRTVCSSVAYLHGPANICTIPSSSRYYRAHFCCRSQLMKTNRSGEWELCKWLARHFADADGHRHHSANRRLSSTILSAHIIFSLSSELQMRCRL